VRPEGPQVQTNAGNRLTDKSGLLSRRYRPIQTATAAEEELAPVFVGGSDVAVDRLSGLLRHLEPDRLASLRSPDRSREHEA
jgi:hypothetical protein